MSTTESHRGWRLSHSAAHPVTGQWRAERFGVGLCAGTKEALLRMIDVKSAESLQFHDQKAAA